MYRLVVDNTQAKTAMGATKAEVASFKAATEDAYKRTAEYARQSGGGQSSGWQQQIGAVTGVIGKLTAAVGVATLFYALGQKIRDVFKSAADHAGEFRDSLDVTDSAGALKLVNEELATLQARLDASMGGGLKGAFASALNLATGDTVGKLRARIDDLQKDSARLERSARGEQEIVGRDADKKARDEKAKADKDAAIKARKESAAEFLDLEKDAARDAMSEREQIEEDSLRKIDALNKATREGGIDQDRAEAAKSLVFDVLRDNLAKFDAAREKSHNEEMKRIKDRENAEVTAAQRASDAWRRFRDEQIGSQRSTQIGAIPIGINTNPAGGR